MYTTKSTPISDEHAMVQIQTMQMNSNYHVSLVVLECRTGFRGGNVTFSRRIGNTIMEVAPDAEGRRTIWSSYQIIFYLTRDLEGFYFCTVDNITSSNEVELIGG